jgi:hypothetical protein
MSEPKQLEDSVRDLIVDLCAVLYQHGYQEISMGALMRVIGVSSDRASAHDQQLIDLCEHFANQKIPHKNQQVPPGTVFH